MKKINRTAKGKKAISAVIGGVIILALIFSVITAYFLFDYKVSTSVDQAQNERAILDNMANSQNYTVGGFLYPPPSTDLTLYINITNTGPAAIQIASVFVGDLTTNSLVGIDNLVCSCAGRATVVINPGTWALVSGNYTCNFCTVWIKVTTTLGTSKLGFYPPGINVNSGGTSFGALTSQTIGDIFLDFHSYTYYTVTSGTACPGTRGAGDSIYCLTKPEQAFTICCTGSGSVKYNISTIAFSVKVRNVNPAFLNITLDAFSQFFQFWPQGSSLRNAVWFIFSYDATTGYIYNTYNPQSGFLTNTYNKTVAPETLLYFANACGGNCQSEIPASPFAPATYATGSNALPGPEVVSTFIFAHGWKGNGSSSTTLIPKVGIQNYGQNIPFVTTKYCDVWSDPYCNT